MCVCFTLTLSICWQALRLFPHLRYFEHRCSEHGNAGISLRHWCHFIWKYPAVGLLDPMVVPFVIVWRSAMLFPWSFYFNNYTFHLQNYHLFPLDNLSFLIFSFCSYITFHIPIVICPCYPLVLYAYLRIILKSLCSKSNVWIFLETVSVNFFPWMGRSFLFICIFVTFLLLKTETFEHYDVVTLEIRFSHPLSVFWGLVLFACLGFV